MSEIRLSHDAARQGDLWGRAVRDWREVMEPCLVPLWNVALDAVSPLSGIRLLDAGCGTGGAAVLAASRGAVVSGIDASANSVAVAIERLPGADFRTGDLQSIPFGDASFDAAIAVNSVQFTADPVRALQELRRVTRPGGRIAAVIWSSPERSDQKALFDAVIELFPEPPKGQGALALACPGELEAIVEQAGLAWLKDVEVELQMKFADLDAALRGQFSTGPTIRAASILGEERVRRALSDALRQFRWQSGDVQMTNRFRCVSLG